MEPKTRKVRVAAIQASSVNGAAQRNLDNCARLVARAVSQGAELVLCPEFLAAGYSYEESIWEAGELRGGLTETWLEGLAREHGITIGATFLEAEGEHFYNTFSLFDPSGCVGRVRKRSLPAFEGWFFTPCDKSKVIETNFGRVAVGICNDNQTAAFMNEVLDHQPDLILMPHSAPTPELPLLLQLYRRIYDDQLSRAAERFARAFGVPVVMANKGSDEVVHTSMPHSPHLPYWPQLSFQWTFRGHSSIVDASGRRVAYLDGGEGVLVEDVVLDPAAKRAKAKPRGYWSFPPVLFRRAGGELLRRLEKLGMKAYRDNPRRRQAALNVQLAAAADESARN